jgi:hypothetical protein
MLHKTSRERYDKLKTHFRRLMRNFNVDDLEDFILTANSMHLWMENDPSLVQEQRDAVAQFRVDVSVDWQFCHQIANQQKHPRPQNHGRSVPQVNYSCEQEALAFVIRTFKHFHYMFEMAPVPPAQRQIPTLADLVGV